VNRAVTLCERAGDLGALVGRLAWRLLARRRRIAIDNVVQALGPEPGGEPAERIAHRSFEQLGRTFLEFLALPAHSRESLLARIEITGFEPAGRWMEERRGAIFLTGHFGNWELLGAAFGWTYATPHYVLPRQTNPASDAYLNEVRQKLGIVCYMIEDECSHRCARSSVADFSACCRIRTRGRSGSTSFFGRLASTLTGPARLAIAAKVPILIAVMERAERGRFRARMVRVIEPSPGADLETEIYRITREVNEAFEGAIRARPDDWYWIHRRWKTPPPHAAVVAPAARDADPALRR
jgi:KDO2-lipid IV(A) lauroyltransferase